MKKTLFALACTVLMSGTALLAQDTPKKEETKMHESSKMHGKKHKGTMKVHHKVTRKVTTPN